MIRINLLPREERVTKRQKNFPKLGNLAPFAALPVVLGLIGVSAGLERAKLATLRSDVAEVRDEVRAIQPQVDRVNRLTAKREELERRLDVIKQLDEDRFLAVRIMDDMSRQMPKYLWLEDMNQAGPNRLTVNGVTFSNLIVADLMMRMERSSMFAGVDLTQTERGQIDGRDVIRFSITSDITPNGTAEDFTADAVWEEE